MKTDIKDLPNSQKEITVEISVEEMKNYVKEATDNISKEMKVDGFRPGKVPAEIVKQKINEAQIYQEAGELAIRKTYLQILKESGLEVIGQPKVDLTKITPGNSLEYKIVLTILPKIELYDYSKVKGKLEKIEVADERIDKELENLRKSRAKFITTTEAIQQSDKVEIDFEGMLDGKTIEGGETKKQSLIIGESHFIPGFEENLIGLKEKEEKEFNIVFPKEYQKKELAGQKVTFKIKINLVQKQELPEINDEFVKGLGNIKDVAELKGNIRKALEEQEKTKAERDLKEKIADEIIKGTKVDVPDLLVEEELNFMLKELEGNVLQSGMEFEQFLKNSKTNREELRVKYRENAVKRAKWNLIVREISKREKLEIKEEELKQRMEEVLKAYPEEEKAKVNMDRFREYISEVMITERVFSLLDKIASDNSK
ncbi:trigger factor [Candidatus Parcubacteria bacterium]|nr:trigger factor [Candidatus Parcubacteria bacterium]